MTPHVLIVDDCTDIARIIARYLESAGYRTTTAGNGLAAQELLAQSTFDCVILDIMMPGMSGTELLHDLRRNATTHDLPVVLVSARVGHSTHFRSEADADYCVGKPFTRQQIVQAVRAVLYVKKSVASAATPRMPAPPPDVSAASNAVPLFR